jgi:hypothetical protein
VPLSCCRTFLGAFCFHWRSPAPHTGRFGSGLPLSTRPRCVRRRAGWPGFVFGSPRGNCPSCCCSDLNHGDRSGRLLAGSAPRIGDHGGRRWSTCAEARRLQHQPSRRVYQARQSLCPISAPTTEQPHCAAFVGDLHSVSVKLGLMQPFVSGRNAVGCYRGARFDECVHGHQRERATP